MTSNVVSAWRELMQRREAAAAALAEIDREIAEVRELLGGGDAPAAAAATKPRRQGGSKVRVSSGPMPAPPAATSVTPKPHSATAVRREALVERLRKASMPLTREGLGASSYDLQMLMESGQIRQVGKGRAAAYELTVPAKPAPRTNGSGRKPGDDYDVAWSGRQSLTGGA